jgi:hypothetical protein
MAGQHTDGAFALLQRDRGLLANTRNFCRFVIARLLEPLINAAARWHGVVLFLKTSPICIHISSAIDSLEGRIKLDFLKLRVDRRFYDFIATHPRRFYFQTTSLPLASPLRKMRPTT